MNGEIEQSQWATYLNAFSERNRMRPVRLQLVGEEIGSQEDAQHLPLTGISLDKGDDASRVEIMLGGQTAADTRHLAHTVTSVERIIPKIGDDGRDDALEIEAKDGAKTIIVFEQLPQLEANTT